MGRQDTPDLLPDIVLVSACGDTDSESGWGIICTFYVGSLDTFDAEQVLAQ
jgi:hypothetical protein